MHATLWNDVSQAIEAFFADLREHNAADNVLLFLFTEFGRRVRDNGSGTDHGAGGAAFVLGDRVQGGQYGEYPSRKPADLTQGDLAPTLDFRGVYATILEDWLHVDAQAHRQGHVRETALSLRVRPLPCSPPLPPGEGRGEGSPPA